MLRIKTDLKLGKNLPLISCLLMVVILTVGCQPLKQKFIRKKKGNNASREFIPVLDPIDYGPATVTSKDRYSKHYSLYRVWFRDFVQNIDSRSSDKKMKYLVDQMIVNLTEMQRWVVEEKRIDIGDYIIETSKVRDKLDEPSQLRSIERLKVKIDRIGRKLIREMNPDLMEPFYIRK